MRDLAKPILDGPRPRRGRDLVQFGLLAILGCAACARSALVPTDSGGQAASDSADAAVSTPCHWLGFWPQVTYPALAHPTWLTVGDFDRDGHLDIAVSIHDGNVVSLYRNQGRGTFGPQAAYAGVTSPNGIVSADFDGDTFSDLAVTGDVTAEGTLAIVANRRDGSFAPPRLYDIGAGNARAGFVAAGDVDGDGHPDLVATSYSAGVVAVLLNAGNGTFLPASTFGLSHANQVSLADLDGDGALDAAVAGPTGNDTFTTLFGDGHGGLRMGSTYSGPESGCCFIDLVTGNFRGKGTDVFAAGAHSLAFYANDGHGRFAGSGRSVLGSTSLAAADFNRDGILDLAVNTATSVWLMLNPGDGQLRDPDYSFAAGSSPRGIATGDFDGDGYPDVAVANADSDTISILLSRCEADDDVEDAR
jgi:hypothetical protein